MRKQRQHKYYFIYKTSCTLCDSYYVGKHCANSLEDGYLGSGKRLKQHLLSHGIENAKREVLEYLFDADTLKKREREIVNEELLKDELCLNLAKGGGGQAFISDATKAKISKANSGKKRSDEARIKNSLSHLGKTHSDETRKKMADAHTGKQYCLGNSRPDDVKIRISASMVGMKKSEETKLKMVIAARAREAKKRLQKELK